MRLELINVKKLFRTIIILFIIMSFIYIILSNKSYSKSENKYKTIIISSGDTLWKIAKEEKNYNLYYKDKDIRYVIYDIQKVNNITNSNLFENQKILIPTYE